MIEHMLSCGQFLSEQSISNVRKTNCNAIYLHILQRILRRGCGAGESVGLRGNFANISVSISPSPSAMLLKFETYMCSVSTHS